MASQDRKRRPPISFHGKALNACWSGLSKEARLSHAETAKDWNIRGPDAEFKGR